MKTKLLALSLLLLPASAGMAQSAWQRPQSATQSPQPASSQKHNAKAAADAPYLRGAVPEVDGKVVFSHSVGNGGRSAAQSYELLLAKLQGLTSADNQIKSQVAIVNEQSHEIGATFEEWMDFKKTALTHDRTRFYYVLHARCNADSVHFTVSRLRYLYEEERSPLQLTAEEWISDKSALNKKGTKLLPVSAKFRRKTVDRIKELFNELESAIKN